VLFAKASQTDLGQAGPDPFIREGADGAFHILTRERAGERDTVDDLPGRFSGPDEILNARQN
jgi:hypothetical protein